MIDLKPLKSYVSHYVAPPVADFLVPLEVRPMQSSASQSIMQSTMQVTIHHQSHNPSCKPQLITIYIVRLTSSPSTTSLD